MTKVSRLLLVALVVGGLRAGEPASGKVLILDSGRTLEGEIERDGDEYRVRRAIGTTHVPAARVSKLCASKADALAYLRGRANLEDPDERLRLARWCHLEGMREDAVKEARQALALRPEHAESKRLLGYLEQWAKHANTPAP